MGSCMPITIIGKGKEFSTVAKVGGYTGKTETVDPIRDIRDGYMIWLDLAQSRKVPAVGKRVVVKIGGKKFVGKVIGAPSRGRYGRYRNRLKKILLSQKVGEKLSLKEIKMLHDYAKALAPEKCVC